MNKILAAMLLAVGLGAAAAPLAAQTRQAVVRISPFTGEGLSPGELVTLERLVASYVVELKAFRVTDDTGRDLALSETELALAMGDAGAPPSQLSADFILGGNVGKVGDTYVFTLENTKVSTGEKLVVSETAHSVNDIVVRSRALTRSLFGDIGEAAATQGMADAAPRLEVAPGPSPALLAGSWRGDKGLETVRLFANGTGVAILSAGGSIRLKFTVNGSVIEVLQDQPNDPAMYRSASITAETARLIAAQARPMRWIFSLTADGKLLSGIKESVSVSGAGSTIRVDNTYAREASWSRISR